MCGLAKNANDYYVVNFHLFFFLGSSHNLLCNKWIRDTSCGRNEMEYVYISKCTWRPLLQFSSSAIWQAREWFAKNLIIIREHLHNS